jgi:protein SCO1
MRVTARTLVLLAAALLALSAAHSAEPRLKAGTFSPARPAPGFSLNGSQGGLLELARYRGKVVVIGFGYTSCPEVCPTTLAVLAQARRKLGAAAGDVQVIYITVDPARDDAARMKQYLATFDPTFLGATGSNEQLVAVRKQYGIAAEKHERGNTYDFAHSSSTYLVDRAGQLRALMPYGRGPDDYVHDLAILLRDPVPATAGR